MRGSMKWKAALVAAVTAATVAVPGVAVASEEDHCEGLDFPFEAMCRITIQAACTVESLEQIRPNAGCMNQG